MKTIPFQTELRPNFPNIYGTKEYREFRDTVFKIDEILINGGLEHQIVCAQLKRLQNSKKTTGSAKEVNCRYGVLQHALRCNIARHLTGDSYRGFSVRLADSQLFQWFTTIHEFSHRKSTSKSTLMRYEKLFDVHWLKSKILIWQSDLSKAQIAESFGLSGPVDFKAAWTDSTCVKANIHFPVDWVLLRDASRSLLSAIKTIRAHGLKHRMPAPSDFQKAMNQLCIQMTHTRRKAGSKKQRKLILRRMKKLTRVIEKHARQYREMLHTNQDKTGWSAAQVQGVLDRIDNVLTQLPAAIHQAHERLIGERQLASRDKVISLFDHTAQIIVRGKAGSDVEFGQRLLLTEQRNGLIMDWELQGKQSQSDEKLLRITVDCIQQHYGCLASIAGDRAFNSDKNDSFLDRRGIYNATCPRSPKALQEKLKDPVFVEHQSRRCQSEGRIGIFKNVFLGKPLRSRVLENKRHAVNWCVLTHNLWVLARMAISDEQSLTVAA